MSESRFKHARLQHGEAELVYVATERALRSCTASRRVTVNAFVPVCENWSEPELTFTFTYIRLEPELAERPPEKAATHS